MIKQFHEGQEVEVAESRGDPRPFRVWRKAKIVRDRAKSGHAANGYEVAFPDGTRAVFDTTHIRAIPNRDLAKMTAEEFQDSYDDCHQCGRVP